MTLRPILIDENGFTADGKHRLVGVNEKKADIMNAVVRMADPPPEHLFMSSEPVAHMYPSDLEKFETSETFATAYSIPVGSPGEKTISLYAHPPITERNFCERCGKRLGDQDNVHTCTPPLEQK